MSQAVLSARAEQLLKTLVDRYIADGQPVGSRALAKESGLDLSPATVRHVMADLEEMGLVHSPHTSSGRVPTELGYRVFVDTLIKIRDLEPGVVRILKQELLFKQDSKHIVESALHLLSELTQLTGIVMVKMLEEQTALRQLEFVLLSGKRLLVILVTDDGQVHNRIISIDRDYTPSELVEAANYFNETYAGKALDQVKRALIREMEQTSDDMHRIMHLAVQMAHRLFEEEQTSSESVVVSGEANLMDIPDMADMGKLRKLFDAFNTKRDLLHLLDQSMRSPGVKIFIGSESGYDAFAECSVITAPYMSDGRVVGTLGVVGPTRLPYDEVISVVDVTARILSGALSTSGR
jgi:heat-inducible transcriptional repressor